MSEGKNTDGEQGSNIAAVRAYAAGVEWDPYLKIAGGVVVGLTLNALAVVLITGSVLSGIVDGVLFLTPGAILAAAVHHRYDPLELPVISPAIMFLTILIANTATLLVRGIRFISSAEPVMSVIVIIVVALMFTPGPFLGAYAVRRWVL